MFVVLQSFRLVKTFPLRLLINVFQVYSVPTVCGECVSQSVRIPKNPEKQIFHNDKSLLMPVSVVMKLLLLCMPAAR